MWLLTWRLAGKKQADTAALSALPSLRSSQAASLRGTVETALLSKNFASLANLPNCAISYAHVCIQLATSTYYPGLVRKVHMHEASVYRRGFGPSGVPDIPIHEPLPQSL